MVLSRLKYLLVSIIILLLLTTAFDLALPSSAQKKIDRRLAKLWPDTSVDYAPMRSATLSDEEQLYRLATPDGRVGYLILDKAMSKYDDFDYMVVFDTAGRILSTSVLVYREEYGGEIASFRWLKQFVGMDAEDAIRLGDEISGISGATISCESATAGIRDLTRKIAQVISEQDTSAK